MGSADSRPAPPEEEEAAAGASVDPAMKRARQAAEPDGTGRRAAELADALSEPFLSKHALGPLMTAADALSLATSAKFLRPYAREIAHLCLGTSSIETATISQVLPVKLTELEWLMTLHLSDRRLVSVVEQALKARALRSLRRLDLTGSSIGDVGMRRLLNGLESARQEVGVEPAKQELPLQELILRQSLLTPKGLGSLADVLRRGVLPELRVLDLSSSPDIGVGGMKALAAAMTGGLGKLEHLAVADAGIHWEGLEALGGALANNGCPELQVLDALGTIDAASWKVSTPPLLLAAIRGGCVPKLRELRIGTTRPHPYSPRVDDTAFLFRSLEMAGFMGLEKLHLVGFEMIDAAADELARILRGQVLETLRELHLEQAGFRERGIGLISDALREGKAPALRSLSLDCGDPSGFSAGAFRTLGEALESGALRELERLVIRLYKERSAAVVLEAVRREEEDDDMLGQTSGGSPEADEASGCDVLAGFLDACPSMKILKLCAVADEGGDEDEEGDMVAAAEEDEDYVYGVDPDGDDADEEEDGVPVGEDMVNRARQA
jgi:hypothetical protein